MEEVSSSRSMDISVSYVVEQETWPLLSVSVFPKCLLAEEMWLFKPKYLQQTPVTIGLPWTSFGAFTIKICKWYYLGIIFNLLFLYYLELTLRSQIKINYEILAYASYFNSNPVRTKRHIDIHTTDSGTLIALPLWRYRVFRRKWNGSYWMREHLIRLHTSKLSYVKECVESLILTITYQINLTLIVIITWDKCLQIY